MQDLPTIAVIAWAVVLVVRSITNRHRRRRLHVTIQVTDLNRDAKEPPPPEGDGGSEQ